MLLLTDRWGAPDPSADTCENIFKAATSHRLTVPPADDLHDGRGEEAHSVHASLAVVDVAFPASVHVLLQHLQRTSALTSDHHSRMVSVRTSYTSNVRVSVSRQQLIKVLINTY